MCSPWQVHKSPGWRTVTWRVPGAPDALSTSTAEAAKDAPRPSTHLRAGSVRARSSVRRNMHAGSKRGAPPSITPPTFTSSACIPAFPPLFSASYSLVAGGLDKGKWGRRKDVSCGATSDPCENDALLSLESSSLVLDLSFPHAPQTPEVQRSSHTLKYEAHLFRES